MSGACKYYLFLAFWLLIFPAGKASAQKPEVDAKIYPDSILIGDQFTMEVTVEADIMQLIAFPEFENGKLAEIIEILDDYPVDTLSRDGRRIILSKKYRLTTFEDGYFNLGQYPLLYIDKNITDTIFSASPLELKVNTFEVDLENQTIFSIKEPMNASFRMGEIAGYIAAVLLALIVAGAVVWLIVRWRRNKHQDTNIYADDPPNLRAIKKLEKLYAQKLWQNNRHKEYYTAITDILREYVDGRFGIHAYEMTSDEILRELRYASITQKALNDMKEIFEVSDLVKFAKYVPDPETNETMYMSAYYFVENTKQSEVEQHHSNDQ